MERRKRGYILDKMMKKIKWFIRFVIEMVSFYLKNLFSRKNIGDDLESYEKNKSVWIELDKPINTDNSKEVKNDGS